MTYPYIKKTITGLISLIAFYFYQALNLQQTILSGTPGNSLNNHTYNLTIYLLIMFLEFFILILGYDTIVNIFSPNFMKQYRVIISGLSTATTAVSLLIGYHIFTNNFINVVKEYMKTNKSSSADNFYLLNEKLSSTPNIFALTLMCALFAISVAILISALIEVFSERTNIK